MGGGFEDPRTPCSRHGEPTDVPLLPSATCAATNPVFDTQDLRRALGQYATGVTVVTARAVDGRRVAMTANSFSSVSLTPPLVLWCPAKSSPSTPAFQAATHFAVNVLAASQHHLALQFATPANDKFADVPTREGIAGTPLIEGAVAQFQCRPVRCLDSGDHLVMIGQVEQYEALGGAPLIFHAGSYRLAARHPGL